MDHKEKNTIRIKFPSQNSGFYKNFPLSTFKLKRIFYVSEYTKMRRNSLESRKRSFFQFIEKLGD